MEQEAELYGMLVAMQPAIRALCKSHPNPQMLLIEFERENEETIALLTASAIPDASIQAYRDVFENIRPSLDV